MTGIGGFAKGARPFFLRKGDQKEVDPPVQAGQEPLFLEDFLNHHITETKSGGRKLTCPEELQEVVVTAASENGSKLPVPVEAF